MYQRRTDLRLLLAVLMLLLVAVPAAADEPQQQPAPDPSPTPAPGSLAAAAAGLKLQRAESGTALVISDANLKSTGSGAALSQGSGAQPAASAQPAAPAATTAPAPSAAAVGNDLAAQLLAQQARVDELEVRLAAMDRQLAEPSADPHYPKTDSSAQLRAPGVVDTAQAERDAVAAELASARALLETLRAQGEKAGIRLQKVANEAPPADG